jgi:hypothetical protein
LPKQQKTVYTQQESEIELRLDGIEKALAARVPKDNFDEIAQGGELKKRKESSRLRPGSLRPFNIPEDKQGEQKN